MRVDTLVSNLVSGMFEIEVRCLTSKMEFFCKEGLTPQTLKREYGNWMVSYITIEHGVMVIGLTSPT